MIFGYATDERSLEVFPSMEKAISAAEGVDVEDGVWLFFAEDGSPLEAVFTTPNQRGNFTVRSGSYSLRPSASSQLRGLLAILPEVTSVEGELDSVDAVRQFLTNRCS